MVIAFLTSWPYQEPLVELSQSPSLCSEASIFALIGLNKHSFVPKIKFTSLEYSAVLAVQAAQ